MALSPWYALAFVVLLIGGLGAAAFSNMQTTVILTEAPPTTRSRVMGIVTMCIGIGPLGVRAGHWLSETRYCRALLLEIGEEVVERLGKGWVREDGVA